MGVLELVDRFRLGRNGENYCASSNLVARKNIILYTVNSIEVEII